eukprot:713416_1
MLCRHRPPSSRSGRGTCQQAFQNPGKTPQYLPLAAVDPKGRHPPASRTTGSLTAACAWRVGHESGPSQSIFDAEKLGRKASRSLSSDSDSDTIDDSEWCAKAGRASFASGGGCNNDWTCDSG